MRVKVFTRGDLWCTNFERDLENEIQDWLDEHRQIQIHSIHQTMGSYISDRKELTMAVVTIFYKEKT